jgi:anaerobic selenocysteine-containing dehydrogenase
MSRPNRRKVGEGLAREDLFTVVHEQFMTDTAELADVVLPATMFLEHDDIYKGGGHQHIMLGPKLIDGRARPGQPFVFEELGKRLGVADREGFGKTERQHIDMMLQKRGLGDFDSFKADKWADVQSDFETAHFLTGLRQGEARQSPWRGGHARKARRRTAPWRGHP